MVDVKREKYLRQIRPFYHDRDMIKILEGMRRAGKSTIMEQIKDELIAEGTPLSNIVYIDLEDIVNKEICTADQLDDLISKSFYGTTGEKYLFIDEIQNVRDFENVINGYRKVGISIFITGSNSYLLSGELVTKLTGRYFEFKILPFSFDEVMEYKKLNGKNIDVNSDFTEYLVYGGLPKRLQYNEQSLQEKYIESVLSESIEKDILKRKKVRDRQLLERVIGYISSIPSCEISTDSIRKFLRNEDISTKTDTIRRYLELIYASNIASRCERYDIVGKKALRTLYKSYLSDMSLHTIKSGKKDELDYGMLIENVVYNELISRGYKVMVGKKWQYEIDFIVHNGLKKAYVQVAYTLNNKNVSKREARPLLSLMDLYPKYIITMDPITVNFNGITVLNLVNDFLLGNKFVV